MMAFQDIEITDDDFLEPAQWMTDYLEKLHLMTGKKSNVAIVTIDPILLEGTTIGVTDKPDGFIRVKYSGDGPDLIVVRSDTTDDEKGRSLIRHEFLHHLHREIDGHVAVLCGGMDTPEFNGYMSLLEDFVKILHAPLAIAGHMNLVYEPQPTIREAAQEIERIAREATA